MIVADATAALLARISIVIPVKDDPLIVDCIASVNEPVEVVVAANGSTDAFIAQVTAIPRDRLRVVSIPEPGIGRAYNAGIEAASGTHILLMDSDCVFSPSTLHLMAAAAADHDLVKGRVLFRQADWQSTFTARTRQYLEDPTKTGRVNAYSPPLLYRRDIVDQMDGYHFDDRMTWREDREFELRRRRADLPVHFVPDATITHKPLSLREDIRSLFAYGRGQYQGEQLGLLPPFAAPHELVKVSRVVRRIVRQRRPAIAAYAAARYACVWIGRWRAKARG